MQSCPHPHSAHDLAMVNHKTYTVERVKIWVIFGPPEGGPILFLLSPEVSGTSGTMSIYIYIYIYVNNMADF